MLSTFDFGTMTQEIGDTTDALTQLKAVRDELLSGGAIDIHASDDDTTFQITEQLRDLAVESAKAKQELERLLEIKFEAEHAGEIGANEKTMAAIRAYNDYNGGGEGLDRDITNLTVKYAALRREIDETIKAMGGLEAKAEAEAAAGTSALATFASQALIVADAVWRIAKVAVPAIAKVTVEIGKVLWKMEPVHKALGKIGAAIQSLWTRIKRVLVYSTIVSFFNEVKSHIKGYLTANKELMSALGEAKGAWITAFMPVLNFVIPKIIALIN